MAFVILWFIVGVVLAPIAADLTDKFWDRQRNPVITWTETHIALAAIMTLILWPFFIIVYLFTKEKGQTNGK